MDGSVNTPGASAAEMAKLRKAVEASTPLSGPEDPTPTTKGAVGQKYLNTTTGNEFTCMAVNDDGTYTWGQPSNSGGGSGSALKLERIYIDTPPTKTAYKAGEVFDPTGMVVKADYAIGNVVIAEGTEVTGYTYPTEALKAGVTSVTITYSEGGVVKTATVAITVTKTSVTIPTYTGSLTYNGQEQTPTFNNNNPAYMTASGDLAATNAGSYSAKFALLNTEYCQWADGTTSEKTVAWSIAKKAPALSVNPSSITLDPDHLTATANVTTDSDGALSVQSSATGVAAASIANKVVTISHVNKTTGSATVTISQAATANYAAASVTLPVTARFITLTITVESGSAVTVQNGSTTLSGTSNGTVKFYLPNTGVWTATATLNGETATGSINITAYQDYTLTLSYVSDVLNDNDWAVIKKVSDAGNGANYWSVGDTKTITINGKAGNFTFSNLSIQVFILGFNHNSSREGANRIHFQIGKISGKMVGLCDSGYGNEQTSAGYFHMNTSRTNSGGWNNSAMRKTLLGNSNTPTSPLANSLMAALPSDLRSNMKSVTKYTDNTGGGSNTASYVTSTTDYLFLLSEFEVFGTRSYANSAEQNYQLQYDYYKAGNSKIAYKHSDTGTAVWWWLRSPYYSRTVTFCIVYTGGYINSSTASWSAAVVPGFAV